MHTAPAGHFLEQVPQLATSVWRLTHFAQGSFPHLVRGDVQVSVAVSWRPGALVPAARRRRRHSFNHAGADGMGLQRLRLSFECAACPAFEAHEPASISSMHDAHRGYDQVWQAAGAQVRTQVLPSQVRGTCMNGGEMSGQ